MLVSKHIRIQAVPRICMLSERVIVFVNKGDQCVCLHSLVVKNVRVYILPPNSVLILKDSLSFYLDISS